MPASGELAELLNNHFLFSSNNTYTLQQNIVLNSWTPINITQINPLITRQLIIDGNNMLITIDIPEFDGLFCGGGYDIENSVILKNFNIICKQNIKCILCKTDDYISVLNSKIILNGDINESGGLITHNEASNYNNMNVFINNVSIIVNGDINASAGSLVGKCGSGGNVTINKSYSIINGDISGNNAGGLVGSGVGSKTGELEKLFTVNNSYCILNGNVTGNKANVFGGQNIASGGILNINNIYIIINGTLNHDTYYLTNFFLESDQPSKINITGSNGVFDFNSSNMKTLSNFSFPDISLCTVYSDFSNNILSDLPSDVFGNNYKLNYKDISGALTVYNLPGLTNLLNVNMLLHVSNDISNYIFTPGINLSNSDLTNCDLTGSDLSGCDLYECDLSGAILVNCVPGPILGIPKYIPYNYHLRNKYIIGPNVNLSNKNLFNTDLSNTDLTHVNLTNVNLTNINLTNTDMSGVILINSVTGPIIGIPKNMPNNYSLRNNFMIGPNINLSNKDLSNTDLSNTNLSGVNLTNINMDNVDLSGVILINCIPGPIIGVPKNIPKNYSLIKTLIIGPNVNLSNKDLSNTDLSNTDLTNVNLTNSNLTNTNLTNVDLSGIIFTNCIPGPIFGIPKSIPNNYSLRKNYIIGPNINLSNKDLSNSDLSNTNLSGANLTNTNLTNSDLSNTVLINSVPGPIVGVPLNLPNNYNLKNNYIFGPNVNLSNINLSGINLTNIDLSGANLTNTILANSIPGPITGIPINIPNNYSLRNKYLIGPNVDLSGKDLSNTDFTGCDLTGVKMSNTNLTNCVTGPLVNVSYIIPINYIIYSVYIIGPKINLSGKNLSELNLSEFNYNLSGSNFTGANLSNVDLSGCNLTNADLSGADIINVNLSNCITGPIIGIPLNIPENYSLNNNFIIGPKINLSDIDLSGYNLSGSNLSGSNLSGSNLSNTDLSGTDLSNSKLFGSNLSNITGVPINIPSTWVFDSSNNRIKTTYTIIEQVNNALTNDKINIYKSNDVVNDIYPTLYKINTTTTTRVNYMNLNMPNVNVIINDISSDTNVLLYLDTYKNLSINNIKSKSIIGTIYFKALDLSGNSIITAQNPITLIINLDTSKNFVILYKYDNNQFKTDVGNKIIGYKIGDVYSFTFTSNSQYCIVPSDSINSQTGGDPHIRPIFGSQFTLPNDIKYVNLLCDQQNKILINAKVAMMRKSDFCNPIYARDTWCDSRKIKYLYNYTYYRQFYISIGEESILINADTLNIISTVNPNKIRYFKLKPKIGIKSLVNNMYYPVFESTQILKIFFSDYILTIISDVMTDERHYINLEYYGSVLIKKCLGSLISQVKTIVLSDIKGTESTFYYDEMKYAMIKDNEQKINNNK